MASKLRDLIRQVRACKTAAEEREIIAKESAALRTAFKEDDPRRHRNVVKLMFMHMLGYPTHFGQMECVKLIAGNGFPEKRMGYLGFMLLLDEKQELLMLVTNSIKNDFNNSNQFVVGVALCAFANLCSTEMASDLALEVAKLLQNGNPYIRKKAALCCVRVVHKVPDFAESLINPAITLITDKHHGVLVAAIKLCIALCQTSSILLEQMRKQTSNLVQVLKNLLTSEYRAEYDVHGIVDPLLQIKILHLLRLLGKGDTDSSDIMSDVLAQVITNTDSSKVPGSAILYECVQTIMDVEATQGLRVLAINVLGHFLSNRDNSIRYVALIMLVKIVPGDFQAIQRHRSTVIECLKDADLSIRKRALDLVYALANEGNVKILIKDLLEFLKSSEREFKKDLTLKICSVIQKFASSKLWYIDNMVNLMCEAGEFVTNDALHTLIVIISNTPELHGYCVRLLYKSLGTWSNQESLAVAAIWCIGEFGEMLINHAGELEKEDPVTITEPEVLDTLEAVSENFWASPNIKAFLLVALFKLSSRYTSCKEKIQELITKYKHCSILELQQRAVEFDAVLTKRHNIRDTLVERIPVLNETVYQSKRADTAVAALGPTVRVASPLLSNHGRYGVSSTVLTKSADADNVSLLDIITEQGLPESDPKGINILQDLLDIDSNVTLKAPIQGVQSKLSNLFSTLTTQQDTLVSGAQASLARGTFCESANVDLRFDAESPIKDNSMDIDMGSNSLPPTESEQFEEIYSAQGPLFPSIVVLQTSRLKVLFDFTKPAHNPQVTIIHGTYLNSSSDLCTDLMLQAAVPKFLHLKLDPASGNVLLPNANGTITQCLTVTNTLHGQKPLMMRIRITYKVNGQEVIEQSQIENFPSGL